MNARRRSCLLALCLFLWLDGCARDRRMRGPERTQLLVDPAAAQALDRMGAGPSLLILLREDSYPQLAAQMSSLGQGVHPLWDECWAKPDPLSSLACLLGLDQAAASGPLPGLDQERPVALGLFEPWHNDTVRLAVSALPDLRPGGVPPMLHRAWLPATDAPRLEKELLLRLSGSELEPHVWQGSEPLPANLSLLASPSGQSFLIIERQTDGLRLLLATGDQSKPDSRQRGMQIIRELMLSPAQPWPERPRPARLHLLSQRAPVLAFFDVARLPDLAAQTGAGKLAEALDSVSPEMRELLAAAGLSELSTSHLFLTEPHKELGAWCLSLQAGEQDLELRMVIDQTEHGQHLARLATTSPAAGLRLRGLAQARLRIDLNLARAAEHARLELAGETLVDPEETSRLLRQCGMFCTLQMLLSRPMALLRQIARSGLEKARLDIPESLQIVWLNAPDDVHRDLPGSLALAAAFGPDFDVATLRVLLTDLGGLAQKVAVVSDKLVGKRWLRLGLGVDPREIFELKSDSASEPGLSLTLEAAEQKLDHSHLSENRSRLGPLEMKLRSVEGAWLLELRRGLAKSRRPWDLHAYANLPGAPEILPAQEMLCLRQARKALAAGLGALSQAAPETNQRLLAKAYVDSLPKLHCAKGQADSLAQAQLLDEGWTLRLAEGHERNFDRRSTLSFLASACKRGQQIACARAEELRAGPELKLPLTEKFLGKRAPASTTIHLLPGEPARPNPANLSATIRRNRKRLENMSARRSANISEAEILLAIDEQASIKTFDSVLEDLGAAGAQTVGVLFKGPDGLKTLDVRLSSTLRSSAPRLKDQDAAPQSARPLGLLGLTSRSGPAPQGHDTPDRFVSTDRFGEQGEPQKSQPAILEVSSTHWKLLSRGHRLQVPRKTEHHPDASGADLLEHLRNANPLHITTEADCRFSDLFEALLLAADNEATAEAILGPVPPAVNREVRVSRGLLAIIGSSPKIADRLENNLGGSSEASLSGFELTDTLVLGSLSKKIILKVLRDASPSLRACHARALRANPQSGGKITATWIVGPTGAVNKVKKIITETKSENLKACLKGWVEGLNFPKPQGGGIVIVSQTFRFNQAD